MSNISDADHLAQLHAELLELFEQAQHLQAQSRHLLDEARQTRASIFVGSDRAVRDTPPISNDTRALPAANVALTPEQTLDTMIVLLSDFSLETQVAIAKALALGVAITAQVRLRVKRPPVA